MAVTRPRPADLDPSRSLSEQVAGRLLAALFVLSGLLLSVALLAPLPPGTHRGPLFALNIAAVVVGLLAWRAPWARHPSACTWVFAPIGVALIAVSGVAGGYEPYSYAVNFTTLFVWLGLARPRWTSLRFLPVTVVAYVVPLVELGRPTAELWTVLWVWPVWVLVAESTSWVVSRLRHSEAEMAAARDGAERLLAAASALNRPGGTATAASAALASAACDLLGADTSIVLLLDPTEPGSLVYRAGAPDLVGRAVGRLPADLLGEPLGRVDPVQDARWRPLLEHVGGTRGLLVPLDGAGQGATVGALLVTWGPGSQPPPPTVVRQASELLRSHGGRLVAQTLGLEQLSKEAETDPLTGLANRRRLRAELGALGPGAALAVIDLDHFKSVNDRYGHAVGDDVLRDLAGCLSVDRRRGEVAARLGGEEFLLVVPTGGLDAALAAVDRLVGRWRARPRLATFSVGVSVLGEDESPSEAMARADIALYAAKEAGRDRVHVAPQPDLVTAGPDARTQYSDLPARWVPDI